MAVPNFTLTDQAGASITLSDYFDAVTLLLFLRGDW
jgi:peroxiredoxin